MIKRKESESIRLLFHAYRGLRSSLIHATSSLGAIAESLEDSGTHLNIRPVEQPNNFEGIEGRNSNPVSPLTAVTSPKSFVAGGNSKTYQLNNLKT